MRKAEAMDLFVSQLIDPFRIGLLFFLLHTAYRTRPTTGLIAPLILGIVFVAILLPLTTARAHPDMVPLWQSVVFGILSNTMILAAFLAIRAAWPKTP